MVEEFSTKVERCLYKLGAATVIIGLGITTDMYISEFGWGIGIGYLIAASGLINLACKIFIWRGLSAVWEAMKLAVSLFCFGFAFWVITQIF